MYSHFCSSGQCCDSRQKLAAKSLTTHCISMRSLYLLQSKTGNSTLGHAFIQGIIIDIVANASSNATSERRHLTLVKQPRKDVPQVTTPGAPINPLAVYTPTAIKTASSCALQSVSQAAQLAGSFSATATANSLVAVKAAARHSAQSTAAAATAVAEFSWELADKTYGLGHRTSVAVYHKVGQVSAGVCVSAMLHHQGFVRMFGQQTHLKRQEPPACILSVKHARDWAL